MVWLPLVGLVLLIALTAACIVTVQSSQVKLPVGVRIALGLLALLILSILVMGLFVLRA